MTILVGAKVGAGDARVVAWRDTPNSKPQSFSDLRMVSYLGFVALNNVSGKTDTVSLPLAFTILSLNSLDLLPTVEASLCLGWVYVPSFLFRFRSKITWHATLVYY